MSKVKTLCLGAVVVAAALIAYSNSLKNGFCWDDHILIENNDFLGNPSNFRTLAEQLALKPIVPVTDVARPVFLASLIADYRLWGNNPEGYHLTNVILHGVNSILVWRAGLLFLSPDAALISGLIFAVHPINTEAVDLASFRPDLLAALFMLLALMAYREMEKTKNPTRAIAALAASALAYGLGIFSKETALVLPAAVLWFDFCFLEKPWRSCLIRRTAALAAFSGLALYYWHFRFHRSGYQSISATASAAVPKTQTRHNRRKSVSALKATAAPQQTVAPSNGEILNPSAPQWNALYHSRALNFRTMSVVFADYFRLMVVPYPLRADRAPPLILSWKDVRLKIAWGILLALFLIALWAYASDLPTNLRPLCWALGWCLIALAPASNIIRLYNPMAERYLYTPVIGMCWILGWIFARGLAPTSKRMRWGRPLTTALALGSIMVIFTVMTRTRNRDWRSDANLFRREAGLGTTNARVYYNLGYLKQAQGDLDGAEQDYKTAIALNPNYVEAINNLAGLQEMQGHDKNALALYSQAASFKPSNSIPYDGLGKALELKNNLAGAEAAYRKALQKNPNDIPARTSLAGILVKEGWPGIAVNELQDALRRSPENFDVLYRLASLLDNLGQRQEAIDAWMSFLTLQPQNAHALMNLGVIYDHTGNFPQAVKLLEQAARIDPTNASAYYNLGVAQNHSGRPQDAEKSLEKALALNKNYLDAAYNLAAVEQMMGSTPKAIAQYKKALDIDPNKIEVLNNIAGLYQMQGNLDQAKKYMTLALNASSPHPSSILSNLGNVYLQNGNFAQAIQYYSEAISHVFPADWSRNLAPTLTNLGFCYYRQGHLVQAENAWQESIKKFPNYLPAYKLLARAYRESGRENDAQALLRQAATASGHDGP